jgi:mRNA (2'-O-methyladenosine-N6-)-methyltransferase
MREMNIKLLKFLKENAHYLCTPPIGGNPLTIHSLYSMLEHISFDEFKGRLDELVKLDKHSLEYSLFQDHIVFINELNLDILIKTLIRTPLESSPPAKFDLDDLLEDDEPQHLKDLRSLLSYESTGSQLSAQRIAKTTTKTPFLPTCNDNNHARLTTQTQTGKFPQELIQCLNTKIHFIPIIKPHTDISLGDCSYLDTCHKLDSCRYVHYVKHIPESALLDEMIQCEEYNEMIPYWEKISPWCPNGSVANLSREVLAPQWINCDVRQFDFEILGKFAAVIADRELLVDSFHGEYTDNLS